MGSHFLPKSPLFGQNQLVWQKLAGSADGSVRYCGSVTLRCRISVSAVTGKPRFGRTLSRTKGEFVGGS